MREYDNKTAPLLDFYTGRGLLTEVDGMGTIDEVGERIKQALEG
jgi:adenylate kinase